MTAWVEYPEPERGIRHSAPWRGSIVGDRDPNRLPVAADHTQRGSCAASLFRSALEVHNGCALPATCDEVGSWPVIRHGGRARWSTLHPAGVGPGDDRSAELRRSPPAVNVCGTTFIHE